MDLKILPSIKSSHFKKNIIGQNPNLKLNILKKDTVSFTSGRQSGTDIPYGADYSMIDSYTTKTKKIEELVKDVKQHKDISSDRDALIYSRTKKAQADAKKFTDEHPEFEFDDICQDLILIAINVPIKN